MVFSRLRNALACAATLGVAALLHAHDPGLSTAEIVVGADSIAVTVGLSPRDARLLLPGAPATSGDAASAAPWREMAAHWCELVTDSGVVAATASTVEPPTPDAVRFRLTDPRGQGSGYSVRLPLIAKLPTGHREFVVVTTAEGAILERRFLTAADSTLRFNVPESHASPTTNEAGSGREVLGFIKLGVEHIWTGYDHLLFLFGLLIVCRRLRSILAIISCFTLAHSLTLAAATLGWVNLSGRLVEPAIAASIVVVGVENVFRRGAEPAGRWVLTFAFGLIHGFGFASALRDLGVGATPAGVVMPLLTFNFGVEIGQIAVALVVLPIVWRLRRSEAFVRRGVPALSVGVAGAGAYWLMMRTVFA
jgi:hydrogenase/urease accessory protein HupE